MVGDGFDIFVSFSVDRDWFRIGLRTVKEATDGAILLLAKLILICSHLCPVLLKSSTGTPMMNTLGLLVCHKVPCPVWLSISSHSRGGQCAIRTSQYSHGQVVCLYCGIK